MRLIRRIDKLTTAAAAAVTKAGDGARVGICWTGDEVRVDASTLGPGEYIACDVDITGLEFEGVISQSVCERVTADPQDLGWVRMAGSLVGRVAAIDGTLVTYIAHVDDGSEAARVARLLPAPAAGAGE